MFELTFEQFKVRICFYRCSEVQPLNGLSISTSHLREFKNELLIPTDQALKVAKGVLTDESVS
jgi:hypothetical protein